MTQVNTSVILSDKAIDVGARLFREHLNRFYKKENWVDSDVNKVEEFHKDLESGVFDCSAPKVITDLEQLKEIAKNLSDGTTPLGALGVDTPDLWIAEEVDAEKLQEFHSKVIECIFETAPWMGKLMSKITNYIVPLGCPETYPKAGFSSNMAKGFIFINFRHLDKEDSVLEYAVDYVHEVSHQLTYLLNEIDPLIEGDLDAPVYSGIKGTDRPASLALHGCIALAYMALFRFYHRKNIGSFEGRSKVAIQTHVRQLQETVDSLNKKCNFTILGKRVFNELNYTLRLVG